MQNEWRDFNGGAWENEVNVRDFIQRNYKPYDGDTDLPNRSFQAKNDPH